MKDSILKVINPLMKALCGIDTRRGEAFFFVARDENYTSANINGQMEDITALLLGIAVKSKGIEMAMRAVVDTLDRKDDEEVGPEVSQPQLPRPRLITNQAMHNMETKQELYDLLAEQLNGDLSMLIERLDRAERRSEFYTKYNAATLRRLKNLIYKATKLRDTIVTSADNGLERSDPEYTSYRVEEGQPEYMRVYEGSDVIATLDQQNLNKPK